MFFVHTFAEEVHRNVYKSGNATLPETSAFSKSYVVQKFSIQTHAFRFSLNFSLRYFKLKSYSSTLKRVRSRWTIYAVGLNVRIK